jgi:hypothetical protein
MSARQRELLMALRQALIVFLRALDDYLGLPPTIPTRRQRQAAVGGDNGIAAVDNE